MQKELFFDRTKEVQQTGLIQTMDKIRKKFGKNSIKTGLTLMGES